MRSRMVVDGISRGWSRRNIAAALLSAMLLSSAWLTFTWRVHAVDAPLDTMGAVTFLRVKFLSLWLVHELNENIQVK